MSEKDFEPLHLYLEAQTHVATDEEFVEISKAAQGFIMASTSVDKTTTPFGPDGRPRMLVLNAWMVHEGRNLNGDAFVKEELKQVVSDGLFSPPYAGMIDDDHDFTARGYWYKTSFAYDDTAKKWGILATGAIWAWRYSDLADRLIQDMTSKGFVDVSMSVIPRHAELTLGYPGAKGERTKVLHNPVFFTTSLLSVPPGDKYARGKVMENPSEIQMKEMSMADAILPENLYERQDIQIQSLIFPKAHWEKAADCEIWAKAHGFNVPAVTENPGAFMIQNRDPSLFVEGSLTVQCILNESDDLQLNPHDMYLCRIKAVIGNRKSNPLDHPGTDS